MDAPVRRLLRKSALLAAPLILILVAYVVCDPFKVLREHADYYDDPNNLPNRDVASTRILLNAPPGTYDSFILGDSRSLAFLTSDWRTYIPADAKPYHFDAWSESLLGLTTKVKYLERSETPVRYALIVLDPWILGQIKNQKTHLFIKDYRISGQSRFEFHAAFLKGWLARGFFIKYLHYRLTGRVMGYMRDVLGGRMFTHVKPSNDLLFTSDEQEIAERGEAFHADTRRFPPRVPLGPAAPIIGTKEREMLQTIRSALDAKHTSYCVVVAPLYDQQPIAPQDRLILEQIFGANHAFDFSGRNELTSDVRGYYETSHFRPVVAREVMRRAYRSFESGPGC